MQVCNSLLIAWASIEHLPVHVSSDGKTVVALLSDSRLLVIKDITRIIKAETTLKDSAIEIHLPCPGLTPAEMDQSAVYLAFEHGRVGVVTASLFLLEFRLCA